MSIENIFVYSFGHSKECYDFYFTNQNVQSKETFFEDTKAAIRQIILDCVLGLVTFASLWIFVVLLFSLN